MRQGIWALTLIALVACKGDDQARTAGGAETALNARCPVSKEKIGSMGPAHIVYYQGKQIALCCPGCAATFSADPRRYAREVSGKADSLAP